MWLSLIDLYESFVSYPTKTVASFHFKSLWVNDLLGVKNRVLSSFLFPQN
jgi:hypothetical protein